MEDQQWIVQKFATSFEACEALLNFAKEHRPQRPLKDEASLIIAGTILRSDVTFKCLVKLCRLGYGEQATMLNRTLFEDMISAHWAARFPKRAARLLQRHDDWARVIRAKAHEKHKIALELSSPLPTWWGKRRKRLRRLFGSGYWSGRSVPRMVEMAAPLWQEADRARLFRMHDVFHQSHNVLMHYSAKSLGVRIESKADGSYVFHTGPSERLVAEALGFAFWTYANTISLALKGADADELNVVATKYDVVVPDRHLRFKEADEDPS